MNEVVVWAGWMGGIAIGLYNITQYWLTSKPLGCSLSYGNFCAMTSRISYFSSGAFETANNWRLWFILGVPLGGLLAAITSPGFEWSFTTSMGVYYDRILPAETWMKASIVVFGGILMGYGARLAGGCTSGHAISGMSLLNPPSMLAGACFFAGGIASVQVLFALLA